MTGLLSLYPDFCREDPTFCAVQQAIEPAVQALEAHLEDCARQTVISTATWALTLWEQAYGIPIDPGKPIDERRSKVRAKLRGAGTTTAESIRQAAAAFSGGEVEVHQLPNWAVEVEFVGTVGIPPNMDDLTAALHEILPAHISMRYKYRYNLWHDIRDKTWGWLKIKTWHQIKSEEVMHRGKYHT